MAACETGRRNEGRRAVPDLPVEPASGGPYPGDMSTRVALLEQIAQANAATFARIDRQLEALRAEQRAEFRWLLGIMLGGFSLTIGGFGAMLGVMAHGFHWL